MNRNYLNSKIVISVLENSIYEKKIFFPERFLRKLEEIMLNSTNEASKVMQLLSAVSAYIYKTREKIFQAEFEKALDDILKIAEKDFFKKSIAILDTESLIDSYESDIIKKSLRYFYFDFLRKPDQYRNRIISVDNPGIYQNMERRRRVFGMETSLKLLKRISEMNKNTSVDKLYEATRYAIESMTYFSSNKIDEEVFNALSTYKLKNTIKNLFFIGIGCALGNDEAEISRIQAEKNDIVFKKIFATDIVHNFLHVAKRIHKDSDVSFEYLDICDLSRGVLNKWKITENDKVVVFLSGVLSRVKHPFFHLSNIVDISDVVIISEGFPFRSDEIYELKNKLENMDEFIEMMNKRVFADKNYSYDILLRKIFEWDVYTLRDGHERFESELIIFEKLGSNADQ